MQWDFRKYTTSRAVLQCRKVHEKRLMYELNYLHWCCKKKLQYSETNCSAKILKRARDFFTFCWANDPNIIVRQKALRQSLEPASIGLKTQDRVLPEVRYLGIIHNWSNFCIDRAWLSKTKHSGTFPTNGHHHSCSTHFIFLIWVLNN